MKRPVDKTKKSNRKCEHCKYYEKETWCCTYNKKYKLDKDYWKVCDNFEWREVKA